MTTIVTLHTNATSCQNLPPYNPQTCADLLNHYEYTSPKTLNCPKIYRYDQVCYFYSNQAVQHWHRTRIYVFNSSQNWPCKNKTYMYKTLCSTMSPCCIQVYHSPDYCVLQRNVSFYTKVCRWYLVYLNNSAMFTNEYQILKTDE